MKKLLLTFALSLALAPTVSAVEYPYMVFTTSGGQTESMDVESLSITVGNGNLTATNGSTSKTFALASLDNMYFSSTQASITDLDADDDTAVEAFTTAGVSAGRFDNVRQAVASLPCGVYVITNGKNSQKISIIR